MHTHESVMIQNAKTILDFSKLPISVGLGISEKPAIKRLAAIMEDTTTDETQKANAIIDWMQQTALGTDLR